MPKKQPLALRQPNDLPEMSEAIDLFESRGLRVTRPSPIHLKCGAINYWPCTGRIYVDNGAKIKVRGLTALQDIILDVQERLPDLRRFIRSIDS